MDSANNYNTTENTATGDNVQPQRDSLRQDSANNFNTTENTATGDNVQPQRDSLRQDSANNFNTTENTATGTNVEHQRDSLRQDSSNNFNTTENTATGANVEHQRDNLRQEEPIKNQNEHHDNNESKTLDSNANPGNEERGPAKGTAGVMESNFGADNTTTSTFEKSQGEKYGEKFDETGAQLKGKFSVSEPSAEASGSGAAGSGNSGASGSDKSASHKKGDETDAHKEGLAHKLKNKAEGILHGHHDNKAESRTEAH